ncbi:uncharacterized protein METZ01_LOCUS248046 [marine metagenome]|uniref:Uncharacterized protein n=1 Tax=marine metagenome TaxID=408172 RepID=A0A382I787_9ZZZZ
MIANLNALVTRAFLYLDSFSIQI